MFKNKKKIIAIFLLFSIVCIFASGVCIIGHECVGENCNICYGFDLLKNIFEQIIFVMIICVGIKKINGTLASTNYTTSLKKHALTLVALKVKLSE